jgi:hypothetical protein
MQQAATAPNNGRMVMLLIAGIPVTMVLAASWLWWFVVRGDLDIVQMLGTANNGTLLDPPRELSAAAAGCSVRHTAALDEHRPAVDLAGDQPWSECGTQCEYKLYLTRQIHMALGQGVPAGASDVGD